jgi:hypothetical protein
LFFVAYSLSSSVYADEPDKKSGISAVASHLDEGARLSRALISASDVSDQDA